MRSRSKYGFPFLAILYPLNSPQRLTLRATKCSNALLFRMLHVALRCSN